MFVCRTLFRNYPAPPFSLVFVCLLLICLLQQVDRNQGTGPSTLHPRVFPPFRFLLLSTLRSFFPFLLSFIPPSFNPPCLPRKSPRAHRFPSPFPMFNFFFFHTRTNCTVAEKNRPCGSGLDLWRYFFNFPPPSIVFLLASPLFCFPISSYLLFFYPSSFLSSSSPLLFFHHLRSLIFFTFPPHIPSISHSSSSSSSLLQFFQLTEGSLKDTWVYNILLSVLMQCLCVQVVCPRVC